ncbi:MAG: tetratricopeptide repeat protein [Planctomycetia bacterium]|nr:tetratricopeptide repeat protein [Planctomycetia bacterium]
MTPPASGEQNPTRSPTAPVSSSPEVPPGSPGKSFGRRFLRVLFTPFRFAYQRPARTLLYLALVLLFAGIATSAGVWVWFDHHLRAARTELARGHNAAAARHLRQCQRVRPDDREVLLLSARVARRSGSWDEAELLLDRCSQLHGEDGELVLERVLLRMARGEIESVGLAVMARIREGGPNAALAREALVTGLIYRFHWGEAYRQLDDWLATEPDATVALLLRGKLEEQRLAFAPARDLYRRIVELDPEHDEARLRLTTLLLADRHGEEALEHLAKLRQRLPEHPEVAVQWARALALQGRAAESRAALAACLRDHPDYPPALAERGAQALLDGDEGEAEQYLARAVALDPGNVATRTQYALALARNGKRDEAAREQVQIDALKADLDRITVLITGPLQERPNDPKIHHEIAQIALRSGQVREAIRWFTSALQVDPAHVPTHLALAILYRELGNPVLSARHRALAHRPGEPIPKL